MRVTRPPSQIKLTAASIALVFESDNHAVLVPHAFRRRVVILPISDKQVVPVCHRALRRGRAVGHRGLRNPNKLSENPKYEWKIPKLISFWVGESSRWGGRIVTFSSFLPRFCRAFLRFFGIFRAIFEIFRPSARTSTRILTLGGAGGTRGHRA